MHLTPTATATTWERDIPVIPLRVEGSRALFDVLDSLEKIRRLEVRMVCPGHGRPFADLPAAVARSQRRIKAYLKQPEELGNDQLGTSRPRHSHLHRRQAFH